MSDIVETRAEFDGHGQHCDRCGYHWTRHAAQVPGKLFCPEFKDLSEDALSRIGRIGSHNGFALAHFEELAQLVTEVRRRRAESLSVARHSDDCDMVTMTRPCSCRSERKVGGR